METGRGMEIGMQMGIETEIEMEMAEEIILVIIKKKDRFYGAGLFFYIYKTSRRLCDGLSFFE
ncbi:MAG: hypothetical protein K0R51_927 [Cytophagaceae bacterium]|nr:hypothetical protein [Cytophagaceae bacterium]